jgi:preprotein translocase subunit YajC
VGFLIFLLFAFVLMWLLVVMPQRRRQAQQRDMVESIRVGTEVLTAGGLYGDVVEVGEDEFALEIAPGVVVRIAARAVAAVIPPDAYEEEEEAAELAPAEEVAASVPDPEQQPPNGVPERS